jgi:hypothetical protein
MVDGDVRPCISAGVAVPAGCEKKKNPVLGRVVSTWIHSIGCFLEELDQRIYFHRGMSFASWSSTLLDSDPIL